MTSRSVFATLIIGLACVCDRSEVSYHIGNSIHGRVTKFIQVQLHVSAAFDAQVI